MNKRIKELLMNSGVGDNWNDADWYTLSPSMVEKFAELIIYECVGQCIRESLLHYSGATTDIPAGGPDPTEYAAYKATIRCRVNIKEHFGVE